MPPTAPVISWDVAKANADKAYSTIYAAVTQSGAVGALTAGYIAGLAYAVILLLSFIVLGTLQAVIAIGSWVGSQFLNLIGQAQQENREQMNTLIASVLNESLGTEISGASLNSGSGQGASFEQHRQLGAAILGILFQGFGGAGPVEPDTGAQNAEKFLGFGVNFATSQGFLSILSEVASLGFLKEFHELPDTLLSAMGISRLQRQALQPLVHNAISKPYDLYMRQQMRADRLSEAQYVAAFHAGKIDESTLTMHLQQKGYRDEDIALLVGALTVRVNPAQLFALVLNGDLTQDAAIAELQASGFTLQRAQQTFKALDYAKGDAMVGSILGELETAYVSGHVDETTYNNLLSKLPLSDSQDAMFRQKVGFKKEVARKSLGFAEVKSAIVSGLEDFTYLDTWLVNEGYDDEAQKILTLQVLEALQAADLKEQVKKFKRAQLAAKGKPIPPNLEG